MTRRGNVVGAILIGGLAAGTIDIGAAVLISGRSAPFILQFIASGLIGKAQAFGGGSGTVALGLVLQWLMSLIIAAVFVLASLRLPHLRGMWVRGGLAYGVIVYFVMSYVVMPLSRVGHAPKFVFASFMENIAAMLVFGLIVAGVARWRLGGGRG